MANLRFPISLAACQAGLSEYLLRIWEQRYGAVVPLRTATNRRLYTAEHIQRLKLLRAVTRSGYSIGSVAGLSNRKLQEILATIERRAEVPHHAGSACESAEELVQECLLAIRALDPVSLEAALERSATALGGLGSLRQVVAPLAEKIGSLWREGRLTAAHEHFATAGLRVFLGRSANAYGSLAHAPVLVVATPLGQVHELGALLAIAMGSHLGWRVVYLGASLPAPEIAGAARDSRARAVALSIVYPEGDAQLSAELKRLRKCLFGNVAIIVGGRSAAAYRDELRSIRAILLQDLGELGETLDRLRQPGRRNDQRKRSGSLANS